MLNEIREYAQYTGEITDENFKYRLKYRYMITKSFAGLFRPMYIIARNFIFTEFKDLPTVEERIEHTKYILKIWMGDYDAGDEKKVGFKADLEKYAFLDHWIENYIRALYDSDSKGSMDKEELEQTIKKLKEGRNSEIYPSDTRFRVGNVNDRNRITYDRVIAEAFQGGELKRYYLACKCDEDDLLKVMPREKENSNCSLKKEWDTMLKITACYLLKYSNRKDGYKKTVDVDFSNWTIDDARMDRLYAKKECKYKYKEMNLFDKIQASEGNQGDWLLKINEKWLKDFEWMILPEDELEKKQNENANLIFFSDRGSGMSLAMNKKYAAEDLQERGTMKSSNMETFNIEAVCSYEKDIPVGCIERR